MSTSTYKTTFLGLLFFIMSFALSAKDTAAKNEKNNVPEIPLYQGVQIGVDLVSPAKRLFSESYGVAVKADVNLKNKYFPTIEAGFDQFDKTGTNGTRYTASGNFIKLGVNKALSYNGKKAENIFFTGAHLGFSAFSYNLKNMVLYPNYWETVVSELSHEKASVEWIELAAGVRIRIIDPISLGWTALYRSTLHVSNGENSIPAYIPGYGENLKPKATIVLHLYYRLPF